MNISNTLIKHLFLLGLGTILALGKCYAEPIKTTSPYEFASVFVEHLVDTHQIEEIANREIEEIQKSSKNSNQQEKFLLSAIRNGTRAKLKLNFMISRLKQVQLADSNFTKLTPYLIEMLARKVDLFDEIIQSAKALLAGPKPDIDYGKLAGHMPEVTAQVEFVNESIFQATPMVGMLLISNKPDSKNHLSHLSITRQEAKKLVTRLQTAFGKSLNEKDQNWTTGSASLMLTVLRDKGYKYSDDPWR